jgi:hypothetical protein
MLEVKFPHAVMDDYQKEVLTAEGNIILMCGRQVGKSEIVAKKIAEYLLNTPKQHILIVSGVERQASGLYSKTLQLIEASQKNSLKTGKDKPLRTFFHLKNGSILRTEPIGLDGSGARQHTLNGIVFEEMQLIPEEAFAAITPMLLTTGGFIWMLGTAWAAEGYVYERLSDPNFKVFRINSEEIANLRPEPARTIMLHHLELEKQRLTECQYAQEYLAIPSSNVRQIFPDALIKKTCRLKRSGIITGQDYVCGVDPAGLGDDEGSISILQSDETREEMRQIEHEVTTKLYTTQTTERIIDLDNRYNFRKIYVDDGGIGFGVFSELLKEDQTKFKTVALNNSARPLDYKDERRKKILGDEMIFNLLVMMEKGKIQLLDDAEIRESLKSYKFEYSKDRKDLIISSNYNHPVQSIMRAAWHAQRKDLKLSVHSIKV